MMVIPFVSRNQLVLGLLVSHSERTRNTCELNTRISSGNTTSNLYISCPGLYVEKGLWGMQNVSEQLDKYFPGTDQGAQVNDNHTAYIAEDLGY